MIGRVIVLIPFWMLALDLAGAGERQLCQVEPVGAGHYRTKVDDKPMRCYYDGPRMKDRRELYWAEAPMAPPKQDGEFEQRWKGTQ